MNKDALRKFREGREAKQAAQRSYVEVNYLSPKVGEPIRFKLLNWVDPETQLFFHSLQINWVPAEGKTYPLKTDADNMINKVYNALKQSKNPRLYQLAGKIKPADTALAHVIDMEDYQLKVLRLDADGIDAMAAIVLNTTDVELTDLNNKVVFEVLKELEPYKIKGGQTRNRRKYTVQLLEDENFVLVPKTRDALDELVDLSTLYSAPDAEFASTVITNFLAENDLDIDTVLGGLRTSTKSAAEVLEESSETSDETFVEAAGNPTPIEKTTTPAVSATKSGFPAAKPLSSLKATPVTAKNTAVVTNGKTLAKTTSASTKTTIAPVIAKKAMAASKASAKPAAEQLTADDAYSDIDDFLKEGIE